MDIIRCGETSIIAQHIVGWQQYNSHVRVWTHGGHVVELHVASSDDALAVLERVALEHDPLHPAGPVIYTIQPSQSPW